MNLLQGSCITSLAIAKVGTKQDIPFLILYFQVDIYLNRAYVLSPINQFSLLQQPH